MPSLVGLLGGLVTFGEHRTVLAPLHRDRAVVGVFAGPQHMAAVLAARRPATSSRKLHQRERQPFTGGRHADLRPATQQRLQMPRCRCTVVLSAVPQMQISASLPPVGSPVGSVGSGSEG